MMFYPKRNFRAELLDLDEAPFAEVKDSLGDVQTVNKYLSGYSSLLFHVEQFLKQHKADRPFTILDAATGSADQPVAVVKLARKLKIPIRITGIDINRKMLRFAQEETKDYPEINFVQCDIHKLPFNPNSFDLAMNCLSLHHFERDDAVKVIRVLSILGKKGFIINDLHRSRVAHAFIFVLTRIFTKNRLTRYDAPVSVMNAFTPDEMRTMAQEAGLQNAIVHRHFPYRLALVGTKP